ncbi:MAG: carboxylating nicotinate-nucleotide diphosphorylase [Candidatus Hodarchaeota archaeon]
MDPKYRIIVEEKLKDFLQEDIHFEDVSSTIIPEDEVGKAEIIAKQDGVLAGVEELQVIFGIVNCEVSLAKKEGDLVTKGDVIAKINGSLRSILLVERTALNILMHLSGIATKTRKFQEIIAKERTNENCRIAATRKTIPGMRIMEKRAVKVGGGDTHRWNLDDMVLLKDTHRTYFGDVESMVKKSREITSFSKKIEVEVETTDDAVLATKAGADIIMLDNMAFDDMKTTVEKLVELGLRDKVILESSGNVTIETLPEHAKTGVDLISTSAITLKAPPVDFSLEFMK